MRRSLAYIVLLAMLGLTALVAQNKTPPTKLTFTTKNGNVTFDHSAHIKREQSNCSVCHPGLFAQDAKKPIGFRPPHKAQEDKKVACGSCHRAGGAAFATQGNCSNGKCHVTAAKK